MKADHAVALCIVVAILVGNEHGPGVGGCVRLVHELGGRRVVGLHERGWCNLDGTTTLEATTLPDIHVQHVG
jgi:hypothetical protein